jgi:hypothetical protein
MLHTYSCLSHMECRVFDAKCNHIVCASRSGSGNRVGTGRKRDPCAR